MAVSKTMMAAVEALQKFGQLGVSEGFKTSPATLVPLEDVNLTEDEIVAKYTEHEWKKRAFNRQTINKLVREGIAEYTGPGDQTVMLVSEEEKPAEEPAAEMTYWYHPESDSVFTLQPGEILGDSLDEQLAVQITKEEYDQKMVEEPIPLDMRSQIEILPGIETKSVPVMEVIKTEKAEDLPTKPKERIRELEAIVERVFRWTCELRHTSRPDYDLGYSRAQMDMRDILKGRKTPVYHDDNYVKGEE